jgi:nitroimidazol reductase NimA-like FMN-containing flavoprotein (pyridoxamine 5'-phosphate oxidase superfamily)
VIFIRRKDKKVSEMSEILKIMSKCDVCSLALFDKEYPYIIPLNFGYSHIDGVLAIYFHGANEGKKIDLIEDNSNAAFEMYSSCKVISGDKPCNFTTEYESLCGNGKIEILNGEEKIQGLNCIMNNYIENFDYEFSNSEIESVKVLKLNLNEITGKKSLKNI